MQVSIIVATRNRPEKLANTLQALRAQDYPASDYEIIVVDDGSTPPATLPEVTTCPQYRLIRLEGMERSITRNTGATAAQGELIIFVDDDIIVGRDFINAHSRAHQEWPNALLVGAVQLPAATRQQPFAQFRYKLEVSAVPRMRGLVAQPNFCTAQNMSIKRTRFEQLKGFDPTLVVAEDQDFALRHTAGGGTIVYLPETTAIHYDNALDICGFCKRVEWGMARMVLFCRRYADWPDNVERERINGPLRWGAEPWSQSLRKIIKGALAVAPSTACLFAVAALCEKLAPRSAMLNRVYTLLLGLHIFRGYRAGLQQYGPTHPPQQGFAARQNASCLDSS